MIENVMRYCREHHLLHQGMHILAACSGGPDSLALLDFFLQVQRTLQLTVTAAHFEHGIRGQASRDDAAFVAEFCQQHHVPLQCEAADVPAFARQHGLSVELAARELRYRFLWKTCRKVGADVLATAHHADDQAETVLMRIMRGTGMDGLAAMRPQNGRHIRPFLGVTKDEVLAYCRSRNLQPRHDATNDLADCTRNDLRLSVIPYLRRHGNPEVAKSLCQLAELAAEEDDYMEKQLSLCWDKLILLHDGRRMLSLPVFRSLHPAIARRALRRFYREITGNKKDLGFQHIESLRHLLLQGQTGTFLSLPGGWRAEISYDRLCLARQASVQAPLPAVKPAVPGLTPYGDYILQAKFLTRRPLHTGPGEFYMDARGASAGLQLRSRRPGDRMSLPAGHKKIKDIFIDDKIPREARDRLPLLTCGSEVLWVIGHRRGTRYPVGEDTEKILYFRLERKEDKPYDEQGY